MAQERFDANRGFWEVGEGEKMRMNANETIGWAKIILRKCGKRKDKVVCRTSHEACRYHALRKNCTVLGNVASTKLAIHRLLKQKQTKTEGS